MSARYNVPLNGIMMKGMEFSDPIHSSKTHPIPASTPFDPDQRSQRRKLILQDSFALLTLVGTTLLLAVVTYFFFSTFSQHRHVLETRWFARGQQALKAGRPLDAVEDFRSALSLSPGNSAYEYSLAQALAASGKTEEAFSYYSTLRDAAPGDGMLNLQLARLSVKKRDVPMALSYYADALNGDWRAEGIVHRRDARLEMAQYLILQHQPAQAHQALLTAEGNALNDPAVMNQIAALLEQSSFPSDALTAYKRARDHARTNTPEMLQALLGESRVAMALGQYTLALETQEHYMAHVRQTKNPPQSAAAAEAQLDKLQRLVALDPLPSLPPQQRARRLMMGAAIAHKRYQTCLAPLQTAAQNTNGLASLVAPWQTYSHLRLSELARNTSEQDALQSLIGQTESLANELCGSPTGDDALLLQLAMVPNIND